MQDSAQSTKTESAYRLLRRDILATRLRPGAPMKLSALRDRYELGWTPLREALSRLEAEGLVTAISNRGFAVAPVSREALEDLTRARMVIEIPLLVESIENGGSDWESAVVTAHYRLSRCRIAAETASESEIDEWDERHAAFHAALIGAARSSWLSRFQATISDQLRRHHRFLSLAPALRAAEGRHEGYQEAVAALHDAMAIEHHTALMDAALDRDIERARRLMTEHIGITVHVYVQSEDGAHARHRDSETAPVAE
ncbi:GntR family transcriptional regulator [Rhizobiaceae bacterium n13]|uniref:GntR family transcriptional regulator n=1 Tax=Ferirhizobium litorale TaxID=2927786 RepID=A0AAE3QJ80_9HYPH|nr:GntR family transcriptional regulator [Fererhizobium litorale]MDI7864610.1 GntR family transcriptional regulator [Fererhizobium litorale]MDI7924848.1 GntR family transcriptional regulator [Fererhizobium litorale]